MKIENLILNTFCLIAIFMIEVNMGFCQTNENIHTITRPSDGMEFRLYNPPENFQYVKNFPIDVLNNDPDIINLENVKRMDDPRGENYYKVEIKTEDGNVENINLNYSIFTSIGDEELNFIEHINTPYVSYHYYNVIDSIQVRDKYNFGDNCMFLSDHSAVRFLKYNVMVLISSDNGYNYENSVISLARKIDNALINSVKYDTSDSIPAPVIESVEIVEGKPIAGNTISIQINATDPLGKKLFYINSDNPFGTSTFTYYVRKAGTKEFYFWVKNEDNFRILLRKEITF